MLQNITLLQNNIRRRVAPLVVGITLVLVVITLLISQQIGRNQLNSERTIVLDVLTQALENELKEPATELRILANSFAMRQYADLVGFTAVSDFAEEDLLLQNTVIGEFESIMSRNLGTHKRLRYISEENRVFAAVFFASLGQSEQLTASLRSEDTIDATTLRTALASDAGQAFFGNWIGDRTSIYMPVFDIDNADDVSGVLELSISTEGISNALEELFEDDVVNAPDRQFVLVDATGRLLARAGDNDTAEADILTFLTENPSTFVNETLDNDTLVSVQEIPLNGLNTPWRLALVDDVFSSFFVLNVGTIVFVPVLILLALTVALLINATLRPRFQPLFTLQSMLDSVATGRSPEGIIDTGDEFEQLAQGIKRVEAYQTSLREEMQAKNDNYRRNLEVVGRISEGVAAQSDLNTLLDRAINLICNEFGYYHAQVFLVDDVLENAVLVASRGEPGQQMLEQGFKIEIGSESVIGQVTSNREAVIVNDSTQRGRKAHRVNPFLPETRAEMALPLIVGTEIIGALDIQSREKYAFLEEDLPTFRLIANQLSVAIYNLRLVDQAEERVQQINTLNRQLTRLAWEEVQQRDDLQRRYDYDLREIHSGDESEQPEEGGVSTPIVVRGEVIGALEVAQSRGHEFTEGDQVVLRSVAERVALALENARLFQETQISLSETSLLYELTRNLNEAATLGDVIKAMVNSAMLDAAGGQVWIFDAYFGSDRPEIATIVADVAMQPRSSGEDDLTGLQLNLMDHLFFEKLRGDQIMLINDVHEDARLDEGLQKLFERLGGQSIALIPLTVRGIWRGMIMVQFPAPRTYTDREGRIYSALIDQAGVAIDNRLLLQQTEEEVARNENLYASSRLINTAQNSTDLVYAAVATRQYNHLEFALSVLEGSVDETGWPEMAHLVAQSADGNVQPADEQFSIHIAADSPMRNRESQIVLRASSKDDDLPVPSHWLGNKAYRFIAIFPLFSANRPIALFYITSAVAKHLEASDYEFYRALTGQMSSQIQIRSLLQRTEDALDEARRLYVVSGSIAAAQSFEDVYQIAIEHLALPFVNGDSEINIALMLAGDDYTINTPYLRYVCQWNTRTGTQMFEDDENQRVSQESVPIAPMTANGVVDYGDILVAEDIDPKVQDYLLKQNTSSALIVPMAARDTWLGVLVCLSDLPHTFEERFSRFATAVAEQVAIAIDRQRLFDESRDAARRAQDQAQRAFALAEAAQLASRVGQDFETVLGEVFDQVGEAAAFDRWMLVLSDESGKKLEIVTAKVPSMTAVGMKFEHIADRTVVDDAPIVDSYRLNQTIIVNEPSKYPISGNGKNEEDVLKNIEAIYGKHIAVPVRAGGATVGALVMGSNLSRRDIDEGDDQLVSTLATQVGLAVENRRLFEAIQQEQLTLRSILETLPAGVMMFEPDTLRPVIFNRQAEIYLGIEIDTSKPFSIEEYSIYRTGTNLHYPQAEMPIFAALRDGEQKSIDDAAIVFDDGRQQIDLVVDAAPIVDAQGRITAIVAAFQDISNLRNLENTLQENLRETVSLYEAQRQFSEAITIEDVYEALMLQMMLIQPLESYVVMTDNDDNLHVEKALVEPLEDANILKDALYPEQSLYLDDFDDAGFNPDLHTLLTQMNVGVLMTVPIRSTLAGQFSGWLVLFGASSKDLPPTQEPFVSQLADVAATALDNRYLIESQQQAVQEIQNLYATTSNVSAARDIYHMQDVLQDTLNSMSPDYYAAYLEDESTIEGVQVLFNHSPDDMPDIDFYNLLESYELPQRGLFIDNLAATPDPDPVESTLLDAGIKGFAAVYLRPKDTPGGYLIVAYKEPHRFSDGEMRYLTTTADSASVVFNNILLLNQIQFALEETSTLYQASRALSEASTPQNVLEVLVNFLISTHVNQVFVALLNTREWDTAGASVDVVAAWNKESIDLSGVVITAEQFPAWSKLGSRTVVTVDDIYDDESIDPMEQIGIESLDTRSLVVIPLRSAARSIGAIWIGSREPYRYTDSEIRTFQAFGEQASLSMEAAYLLEQTERRARQLQTSAEVTQSAAQILDLEVLMPRLVNLILEAFQYDHVQIFLMDEADRFAEVRASTGEAGRQLLTVKHKLEKGSESVIGQVTARGEPVIALDTADADVVHRPNVYLPQTRSEMAIPLIIQDRIVGALDVQSNQPNAFTDEDVQVLSTLAAQISVAIDNARLYADAQNQADSMGFLFEVTTAAAAAETLDEAFVNVVNRLQDMLAARSATIYLVQLYMDDQSNSFTTLKPMAQAGGSVDLEELDEIHEDNTVHVFNVVRESLQPFVISDIADEPRYVPVADDARSAVLLPLTSANEMIGLIVLEDRRVNAYQYETLQLLLTMTGSLSAVVQSTLLLERLQSTNERLRELDKIKSDFLANMSHELRTPLNSIIGFSRVMLKGIDGPLTEMQEQDLTTIYTSGQHLLMLINDVLDQAKIAAGKLDLKFDYFEVKPLIEAVKSIGIGLVKDKDIDMVVEIAPNLPQVYGDEFRTRQVLLNLVSNAAKFTSEGGVTIRAYKVHDENHGIDMVQIDVIDTGIGIAEKDLPLLFEAFRQVDSSLTRTAGGTGLGLPIAKSLVEMQGGEMMVASEMYVGSTFSITVPTAPVMKDEDDESDDEFTEEEDIIDPVTKPTIEVQSVQPTQSMSSTSPMPILPQKREILLIEDNKDMVDQFRRILQLEGFEVQTADHPAYAEAMVSNLRPTLLVMDVNFSDGEGWNILERLKDRDDTFDIPVIVVSLSNESERAYRLGAHTFIQRPFVPDDLVSAVLKAEQESNTERILIIDDQPDAVRLLTQLLNENGTYRVFSAESGLEGISLVARRRPDLIILDLRMPEMDGFAVLNELRSNPETANIPVLIVTGDVDLKADEQQQLSNVHVLHKTDITEEEFEQFLAEVRGHLNLGQE